ncbi:MAG: tetratricopeptide repeat protein, partial [Alphaproteobacteria bacterium]|nr:tetratricopeptide repeat protein [Alphaproteobacteria bacterium]
LNLGVLVSTKSPSLAQPIFTVAEHLNLSDPRSRDLRGIWNLQEGNFEIANRELKKSMEVAPSLKQHGWFNFQYFRSLPDSTLQAMQAGLANVSQHHPTAANISLAQISLRRGDLQSSAEYWRKAAQAERIPNYKYDLSIRAARDLARLGSLQQATSVLHEAIGIYPRRFAAYETMIREVYSRSGDIEGAEEFLNAAELSGPDHGALVVAFADLASRSGEHRLAKAYLEESLAESVQDHRTSFRLGRLLLEQGEPREALEKFRQCVKYEPALAEYWYYRGLAAESLYQFAEAKVSIAKAVEISPANRLYRSSLSRIVNLIHDSSSQSEVWAQD